MEILKKHLECSNTLKNLLGLRYSPVAVKFIKKDEDFKSNLTIDLNGKYRYCQLIMEAKNEKIICLFFRLGRIRHSNKHGSFKVIEFN